MNEKILKTPTPTPDPRPDGAGSGAGVQNLWSVGRGGVGVWKKFGNRGGAGAGSEKNSEIGVGQAVRKMQKV